MKLILRLITALSRSGRRVRRRYRTVAGTLALLERNPPDRAKPLARPRPMRGSYQRNVFGYSNTVTTCPPVATRSMWKCVWSAVRWRISDVLVSKGFIICS
jgi:hypothetical protein